MLQPSRTKFRKDHKGRRGGLRVAGSTLAFGDFALKAENATWLTSRQIEAARRAITSYVKRGGQIWIRVYPDKPVSSRPAETRMGGGKGAVDHWVAVVRRGRILFEVGDIPEEAARAALKLAADKLPCKSRIVTRAEMMK
ncbi:MAG: 50S ribosomal protein L16 [Dehalococcoidia bacterium]|nr:50S ribosomal protein L16 [Dehalococcoidia bacterium]